MTINRYSLWLLCLTLLTSVTSCDFNANRPEYEVAGGYYEGDMVVGLYTPSFDVEKSNTNLLGHIELCLDTINTSLLFILDNQDWMTTLAETQDTVSFSIPFFTSDGDVRPIFQQGYLGQLYALVHGACMEGDCSFEQLTALHHSLSTLQFSFYSKDFSLLDITTIEQGNFYTSYDWEQNSPYCHTDFLNMDLARTSNLSAALQDVAPIYELLYAQKRMPDHLYQAYKELIDQPDQVVMTDISGYSLVTISAYHLRMEAHLEKDAKLFDNLSKLLYGTDDQGNPLHAIWLTIKYDGDFDPIRSEEYWGSL